ncbi:MAG: hypothetical protein JWM12_3387, partial [Ilumatobacteraceae bacterium]|nr:hypothetical protein [Ilumatobacteraceae bacterium]
MSFLNDRAPAIRRRRTALVIAVAALTSIGVVGVAHAASPSPAREPSDCVPYRWWTCWWGTTTTTAPAGTDDTTPPTGDTTPPTGSTPVSDETTPPTGDTTTPTSPPESTVAPTSTA